MLTFQASQPPSLQQPSPHQTFYPWMAIAGRQEPRANISNLSPPHSIWSPCLQWIYIYFATLPSKVSLMGVCSRCGGHFAQLRWYQGGRHPPPGRQQMPGQFSCPPLTLPLYFLPSPNPKSIGQFSYLAFLCFFFSCPASTWLWLLNVHRCRSWPLFSYEKGSSFRLWLALPQYQSKLSNFKLMHKFLRTMHCIAMQCNVKNSRPSVCAILKNAKIFSSHSHPGSMWTCSILISKKCMDNFASYITKRDHLNECKSGVSTVHRPPTTCPNW